MTRKEILRRIGLGYAALGTIFVIILSITLIPKISLSIIGFFVLTVFAFLIGCDMEGYDKGTDTDGNS
jgi:hypothetical protein